MGQWWSEVGAGSSKATNMVCLAIFDPDTNSALSRYLGIELFVLKAGFASERLIYMYSTLIRASHFVITHTTGAFVYKTTCF